MNMPRTMPFLNADDHIIHQDSLTLDETTYWPEMDEQNASQQTLLDPYIDPQTVMNASEALMRLSEQDLNIEPSLRSLNVNDSHSFPSIQYPIASINQALDMDILNTQSQVPPRPPREPFTGAKIRRWTDTFNLARTHAQGWTKASGPHVSASSFLSSLDSHTHTTTHEAARRPNARQGTGSLSSKPGGSSSKVTGLAKAKGLP